MIRNFIFSFFFILSIFLLSACEPNRFFEENQTIESKKWKYDDAKIFYIDIKDTTAFYTVFINIRHNGNYRYSNLFLQLESKGPNAIKGKQLLEFRLAEEDGKWLGQGIGNLFSYQIPVKKDLKINKAGRYEFILTQEMRDNPLLNVEDIGIRIEKSK